MKMLRQMLLCSAIAFLMVIPVSTEAQSAKYQAGDIVKVNPPSTVLRDAPKKDATVVLSVGGGAQLRIIDGERVFSSPVFWWNVEHIKSGTKGWVEAGEISGPVNEAPSGMATNTPPATIETQPDDLAETSMNADDCWAANASNTIDGPPQWSQPPAQVIQPSEMDYYAEITTEFGEIRIELLAQDTPTAVNNFVCLALAGFYDETDFYRVVPNAFVQGGDPTGTGDGGPGYTFAEELPDEYLSGDVAMANSAPDANGSQFFIAIEDLTEEIPHDYPVFGRVTSGMDVVETIANLPVAPDARGEMSSPKTPVIVHSVSVFELGPRIGPPYVESDNQSNDPETPEATTETEPAATIEIAAKDIFFDPDEIHAPSFQPQDIEITNEGAAVHNFTIDELGVSVDLAPGETGEVTIFAPPGEYEFYCDVPGHKEAGQTGTLIVGQQSGSTSDSDSTSTSGCDGFDEYSEAYEDAFVRAMTGNPDAFAILIGLDSGDFDDPDTLTLEEWGQLSALFTEMANELELIDPPEFARSWHENQIETSRLFASLFEAMGEQGSFVAVLQYADEFDQLEGEGATALLEAASVCPEFRTWAEENGA